MIHKLERMLWQQVKQIVPDKIDTIVFPIGTMEAHGAACLGTDVYIPYDISEHICEKFNYVLAPPVWYGITRSLLAYPGSLTVEPEVLKPYVLDILKSFKRHKFRRIIVMNGHGGNNKVLKDCASIAFRELDLQVAVIHWWLLCAEVTREFYGQEGGHGGIDETGYVMSVDPELADKSYYNDKLVYEHVFAADVYPYPGTIGLYNDKGEGRPDFDYENGKAYSVKVKEKVSDTLKYIIDGWDANL